MLSSLTKVRGAYSAPTMIIYGDVKTLTASGTGTNQENGTPGGPGGCTNAANRRPC